MNLDSLMVRPRRWLGSTSVWCVLVCLLLSPRSIHALDPALSATQYAHTAWNRDLAAPVYALAQTTDGSLWLGAEAGLQRFDGIESRPWKPPAGRHLFNESILALTADRD